jgi:hypothetical protein
MPDPLSVTAGLARTLNHATEPREVFAAVEDAVRRTIGFRLLTILFVLPDRSAVQRIHSSNPAAYPVTGRKPFRTTEWGDNLMVRRRPWLGRTPEDIAWAFFDHELIASLGCGSCINAPVAAFGQVYGTLNILDAPLAYDQAQVPVAEAIAAFLIEPLRRIASA